MYQYTTFQQRFIASINFTSSKYKYRPETAHCLADFKLVNNRSTQFELPGYVH